MQRLLAALGTCLALCVAFLAPSAGALPIAPTPAPPVPGIPQPCRSTHPWPGDDASLEDIRTQFIEHYGIGVTGSLWAEEYRPSIRILWDTFDALDCTSYWDTIVEKAPGIAINAGRISGYAWGDWSLTRPNHITLDFSKFERALDAGDEGRLVRLIVHEFAHAWNTDRFEGPEYWDSFQALRDREGTFSEYAGGKTTEIFADVVGYYVGRCALDNPYTSTEHQAYYDFARTEVFGGREFGPAPGQAAECNLPGADAEVPMPGDPTPPSWVVDLSQE